MSLGRHLSRIVITKILFATLFRGENHNDEAINIALEGLRPSEDNLIFIKKEVAAIMEDVDNIKSELSKYAVERPLDQISLIDQAILYLGTHEILNSKDSDVPALVAINEAVEIAKEYSGENNAKFINGVLNAIYKNYQK